MNKEQMLSAVRTLMKVAGSVLMAYGYFDEGQWEAIAGFVVVIIPIIWDMFVHTQSHAVTVVAEAAKKPDNPILGVIVQPNAAGMKMSQSVPGSTLVVAGSTAAKTMAEN